MNIMISGAGEYCFEREDGSKSYEILSAPDCRLSDPSLMTQVKDFGAMHDAQRVYPVKRPTNKHMAMCWDRWNGGAA